jgi:hypothetical protein
MIDWKTRAGSLIPVLTVASVLATAEPADGQRRPYARKAPIPEDVGSDPYLRIEVTSVLNATVPSRAQVEVPPYPNALVIRSKPVRSLSSSSGERYETLPAVILVTTDAPQQVIEYYEQVLTRWSRREIDDTFHFWLGDGEYDPLGESGKITPSLQIIRAGNIRLVPDAQTEIQVRYHPGGGYR